MTEITASSVSFQVNGTEATGYLACPVGLDDAPGVVVIQEWWGLEPHIKDVTDRFAREGFIALAPDLFHGKLASYEEPDEARKMAQALDRDLAVKEIDGAIRHIKALPMSNNKVGVVGYCLGGALVLHVSIQSTNVDAGNIYYGGNPNPLDTVESIQCPILGLYGQEDQGIPPERVHELEEAMKRFGKEFEFVIYEGAPHAFFNDRRPSYREEVSKDAWGRTLTFFKQHLL